MNDCDFLKFFTYYFISVILVFGANLPLPQISAEKRDVEAIASGIRSLCELRPAAGLREGLVGDWKLLYVNDAETLHSFGTGLGRLPGTSILDAWAAFSADGRITVQEVCRVVGPFPNIRNTLNGAWELRNRAAAGFGAAAPAAAAAAAAPADGELRVTYERLTDGRGKVSTADTGFRVREVAPQPPAHSPPPPPPPPHPPLRLTGGTRVGPCRRPPP